MVDRCKKIGRPTCAVVDLDGTLLRGNSLRLLTRFLVRKLWREHRYPLLGKIGLLLVARRVKAISHVAMKYPIHRIAAELLDAGEIESFTSEWLLPRLNLSLVKRLAAMREEGCGIVIATAAPELYLPALCRHVGADTWLATPLAEKRGDYVEMRGNRKKNMALRLAADSGSEIVLVATDHEDDLPLMTLDGVSRLLVSPTPRLKMMLGLLSLSFEEF